jgi:hypothetical protein
MTENEWNTIREFVYNASPETPHLSRAKKLFQSGGVSTGTEFLMLIRYCIVNHARDFGSESTRNLIGIIDNNLRHLNYSDEQIVDYMNWVVEMDEKEAREMEATKQNRKRMGFEE